MCISDQGLLFIVDGNQGGTFVCDLEGNITKLEAVEGFRGKPTIQGTSADGRYWVGYAREDVIGKGLCKPLLWTDGVAQELPLPDLNYRDEEIWYGVMARGISANGLSTAPPGRTPISACFTGGTKARIPQSRDG